MTLCAVHTWCVIYDCTGPLCYMIIFCQSPPSQNISTGDNSFLNQGPHDWTEICQLSKYFCQTIHISNRVEIDQPSQYFHWCKASARQSIPSENQPDKVSPQRINQTSIPSENQPDKYPFRESTRQVSLQRLNQTSIPSETQSDKYPFRESTRQVSLQRINQTSIPSENQSDKYPFRESIRQVSPQRLNQTSIPSETQSDKYPFRESIRQVSLQRLNQTSIPSAHNRKMSPQPPLDRCPLSLH